MLRDPRAPPQTIQASRRKHESVGFTFVEAPKSSVHVAMERMRPEIRPAGEDETDPSRAVRTDPRSRRQLVE